MRLLLIVFFFISIASSHPMELSVWDGYIPHFEGAQEYDLPQWVESTNAISAGETHTSYGILLAFISPSRPYMHQIPVCLRHDGERLEGLGIIEIDGSKIFYSEIGGTYNLWVCAFHIPDLDSLAGCNCFYLDSIWNRDMIEAPENTDYVVTYQIASDSRENATILYRSVVSALKAKDDLIDLSGGHPVPDAWIESFSWHDSEIALDVRAERYGEAIEIKRSLWQGLNRTDDTISEELQPRMIIDVGQADKAVLMFGDDKIYAEKLLQESLYNGAWE